MIVRYGSRHLLQTPKFPSKMPGTGEAPFIPGKKPGDETPAIGRYVIRQGENKDGNAYRVYNDGAFMYMNKDSNGKTESVYFNTGRGHAFYRPTQGVGNGPWYENQKEGKRHLIRPERKEAPISKSGTKKPRFQNTNS